MTDRADKAGLDPRYLLIALLPAIVFTLSKLVVTNYAIPFDIPPLTFAEFDVNKEGAARIGTLATFMLFMGAASAALLFFAYTLRMFDWRGRILPILAFLAMAFAAIFVSGLGSDREAHDFSGRALACFAAGYDMTQSEAAKARERTATPPARMSIAAVAHLPNWRGCWNERYRKMGSLGALQFLGVAFSFAGLVIGAICCLATSPRRRPLGEEVVPDGAPDALPDDEPAPAADPELVHWEHQSEWLNTYLYLAGLLLATALLFINAYLRWPAYVLLDPARYYDHTAALVSYYGIVFSIMLAAFYIPVATILTGKVKALTSGTPGDSKIPDAFKGPSQILKIVLGLFSTALAGALPGILDLIG